MAVLIGALPAAAQCCGGVDGDTPICGMNDAGCDSASAAAVLLTLDEGALHRRVVELRWELHELGYTDTATGRDIARKRAEYECAREQLRAVRLARANVLRTVVKALGEPVGQRVAGVLGGRYAKSTE